MLSVLMPINCLPLTQFWRTPIGKTMWRRKSKKNQITLCGHTSTPQIPHPTLLSSSIPSYFLWAKSLTAFTSERVLCPWNQWMGVEVLMAGWTYGRTTLVPWAMNCNQTIKTSGLDLTWANTKNSYARWGKDAEPWMLCRSPSRLNCSPGLNTNFSDEFKQRAELAKTTGSIIRTELALIVPMYWPYMDLKSLHSMSDYCSADFCILGSWARLSTS